MPAVTASAEIAAPVSEVFAYVDDFGNAQEWLFGLTRIEPVGGAARRGVGAQYDGTMKLGVTLDSRIECTAWEQDRLIAITSVQGIKNSQRWQFTPLGEERCEIHAHITYAFPGGPAGLAIAKAVKPFVGIAIRQTTENLIGAFEG